MSEPTAQYLRHRDVRDWIEPLGLEMKDFYKLTKSGLIEAIKLAQCKRAYYLKSQVTKHLIQPFRDAEGRAEEPAKHAKDTKGDGGKS